MYSSKKILLVLEMDFAWGRDVANGVVAFARPMLPWRFVRRHASAPVAGLGSFDADGIIGTFYDRNLLRRLRRTGVPLVALEDPCPQGDPGPAVLVDLAGEALVGVMVVHGVLSVREALQLAVDFVDLGVRPAPAVEVLLEALGQPHRPGQRYAE